MNRSILCLLGIVLLSGAFAARGVNPGRSSGANVKAFQWLQKHGKGGDMKEEDAIIAVKYEVPPSLQDKFIDEWKKIEDKTLEEKGNAVYDLKKTWGDNIHFWAYGEWEDMESYMEHFKSDYTSDFLDWLDENDVMWELYPLRNVTDQAAKGKSVSAFSKGKGKGDDPRDMDAHVLIQYHVPPSKVEDFMDTWGETAEKTWDEKENSIYALRKFVTMNHHFVAYGTWESYDAYMDHFVSGHVQKLREWLADNDIEWYAEPLIKMGKQEEKPSVSRRSAKLS